jgi:hypothetical protein
MLVKNSKINESAFRLKILIKMLELGGILLDSSVYLWLFLASSWRSADPLCSMLQKVETQQFEEEGKQSHIHIHINIIKQSHNNHKYCINADSRWEARPKGTNDSRAKSLNTSSVALNPRRITELHLIWKDIILLASKLNIRTWAVPMKKLKYHKFRPAPCSEEYPARLLFRSASSYCINRR